MFVSAQSWFSTNDDDDGDNFTVEEKFNPMVPATQTVPEVYPRVPVVAINRNPLFPKFVKMVEVNDERLVKLLRERVKQH